jgi:hypothetical protein
LLPFTLSSDPIQFSEEGIKKPEMAQTLHSQNPLERVLAIKDSSLRQPEEHPTIVPAVGAALRGIAWTSQQPFLYFAIPATGLSGSSDTITLGAGNIWFQDNYFASGTPAAGYVGLKIASGKYQDYFYRIFCR